MSNETMVLSDEQAVKYGFAPASAAPATTTEVKKETPATEPKTETAPPVEKPTEGVSPKPEVTPPTTSGKPLYTQDEIRQICKDAEATGKINLDTSRLDAPGIALMKSFQQGLDGSWGKAKKMQEEAAKIRADAEAKLAEFERKQKEAENQKLFAKEIEEHGEEEARRRLEIREIKDEQARLRMERDQARQRESRMQIESEYRQASPQYFIPQEPIYQDIILSGIVGRDLLNMGNGLPIPTIEESAALVADAIGFTNVENLWKIIKANPANYDAVRNQIINEYNQERAKGNTVSASSPANVPEPVKRPDDGSDPKKSTLNDILDHFGAKDLSEIKLT